MTACYGGGGNASTHLDLLVQRFVGLSTLSLLAIWACELVQERRLVVQVIDRSLASGRASAVALGAQVLRRRGVFRRLGLYRSRLGG
jgi:hypothetical protein